VCLRLRLRVAWVKTPLLVCPVHRLRQMNPRNRERMAVKNENQYIDKKYNLVEEEKIHAEMIPGINILDSDDG
jgi:hypothetical protein